MVGVPRVLGGRYQVGELIGRGGMADVHVGQDLRINRRVAIKILREDLASDPLFQARFRREAQSAGGLNHPAIVAVYDTGEEPVQTYSGATVNLPYIVMEYVEGHTVRALLSEGDAVPINEAVQITIGVLDALEYSHAKGIVHRDIKPGNVMLTNTGDTKVMDFGIARALADSQSTMTQTNSVVGTAQYLSPEQARGEHVDTRSDLYSTGCLLYELLTGRPPFKGENATSVAVQHVQKLPTPPSKVAADVPDCLDRIVMKALAKDREKRYQDAASFREDLRSAMRGTAVVAPPVDSWHRHTQTRVTNVAEDRNYPQRTENLAATSIARAAAGYAPAPATQTMPLGAQSGPKTQTLSQGLQNLTQNSGQKTEILTGVQGRPQSQPYRPRSFEVNKDADANRVGANPGSNYNNNRSNGWVWVLAVILGIGALVAGYTVWVNYGGSTNVPPAQTQQQVKVPQLAGLDEAGVRSALTNANLSFVKAEDQSSDTVPKGQFISSDPKPGDSVAAQSQVRVTFSSGPGKIAVPDLRGDTQEQARSELKALGLQAGDVNVVNEPGVPAGKILRTTPAAGENVEAGSSVNLVVASGNLEVPSLVNTTKNQAIELVQQAGLVPVVVIELAPTATPGTVIGQNPMPGLVKAGASVKIVVAANGDSNTPEGSEDDGKTNKPSKPHKTGENSGNNSGNTEGNG